jgi:hypothetical protein
MDVHQATISVAVTDSRGKLIMESILETKGGFFLGLSDIWIFNRKINAECAWFQQGGNPELLFLTQCGATLLRLFGVSRGHLTFEKRRQGF